MEQLDKLSALKYLAKHNPVCDDCARGDLNQIRKAAGLYQVVKDITTSDKQTFGQDELDKLIRQATAF